jgi:hypothetical protein
MPGHGDSGINGWSTTMTTETTTDARADIMQLTDEEIDKKSGDVFWVAPEVGALLLAWAATGKPITIRL